MLSPVARGGSQGDQSDRGRADAEPNAGFRLRHDLAAGARPGGRRLPARAIDPVQHESVIASLREVVDQLDVRPLRAGSKYSPASVRARGLCPRQPRIVCVPADRAADEVSAAMLAQAARSHGFQAEAISSRFLRAKSAHDRGEKTGLGLDLRGQSHAAFRVAAISAWNFANKSRTSASPSASGIRRSTWSRFRRIETGGSGKRGDRFRRRVAAHGGAAGFIQRELCRGADAR